MSRRCVAAIFFLSSALLGSADTVIMRNGNKLDGVVIEETTNRVVLSVGVGSVTLKRSQIASIHRATDGAKTIEDEWARKYFAHEKYVPADLKALAAEFNGLEGQRQGALEANRKLQQIVRERVPIQDEMDRVNHEIAGASLTLSDRPTRREVDEYNNAVRHLNDLRLRMVTLVESLKRGHTESDVCRRTLSGYIRAYYDFRDRFSERQANYVGLDTNKAARFFFEGVEKRVESLGADIREVRLPMEHDRNQIVVTARLNGQVDARLLVDTGATTVSISETLARQLQLPLLDDQKIEITVADGSKRDAKSVILSSVEVLGMKVDSVAAAVVPEPPGPGLDGLLGMSYLMEFGVQIDPVRNELTLTRFQPGLR